MEYNTLRPKMIIPEYGRNIQNMIHLLQTIEDREKRTRSAHFIVGVMAQMNPQVKESDDYLHKLWDHLHIISNFKLDVDSPYEPPLPEVYRHRPKHVGYNKNEIRFGHYGYFVSEMIMKAVMYDDGEEKDALIVSIANYMKKQYLNWNRDTVSDEVIGQNLAELSGGRLQLPENVKLASVNEIINKIGLTNQNVPAKQKKKYNMQKNAGQQHRKKQQK
ncbi:MAG: DUF4290 domain-containing protein [Bacteroidales bacterium]|nr:DUF4290 domain-containing protein [Bacteroidales bacterium]